MPIQTILRNATCGLTACAGLIAAQTDAAPRIEGASTRECHDTLVVANIAFHSTAFRLDDAITLPHSAPVEILSQRQAGAPPGVHGVTADAATFKTLPPPRTANPNAMPNAMNVRELYWQVRPTRGIRWVIADQPFNWRGDFYTLFAIDPAITEAGFVPLEDGKDPRAIVTNAWVPPSMLRDKQSGMVWAIDTGPDAWSVYAAGKDGVKQRCTLSFGPKVKTAFDRLPVPVRALAADLNGTLGKGGNEGEPTDRIRDDVAQAWSNVALRPWAVTKKPYHSRRNADLGLRRWSQGAPSFRALYLRIQAEYPAAVDSLTDLYVKSFGKTADEARALARHNLDIVYRSHFVFFQSYIHPAPKETNPPVKASADARRAG